MEIKVIKKNNIDIAVVRSEEPLITSVQSALDFIATVRYEAGSNYIVVNKESFADEFFILSSGLAGEILQRFINYGIKAAIYGDFSKYTSKPLKDFIYESNNGKDLFFQPDEDSAVDKLSTAKK